ncbi:aromatic-ring-hydroxylating dioxygenase subunit beta [Immundisolibacter sp.]|uniref:aromatic-ring-hydroxylating dioxygenase subunit beta n=1 Tax=Immundisolibacter sp. TaxID=1934948 RepID=UPI002625A532|nr:aromatic-ring-hydroxylating dioxygenase subunit beta [Immundisolibacter sp.]MDD3652345.1 aromatic-ring-hydroxylating dioxygenase subunit beta [Immundisolibacter sp.]
MNAATFSLPAGEPVSDADYRRVSEFLFREADLLASRQYDAWLALLAPDLVYRVPLQQFEKRGEQRSYGGDPAWLDETRHSIGVRIRQLTHPQSNADRVPSFLRYFVTNILAVAADDGPRVASQVLLLRVRANNPQPFLLSAARDDLLRPQGGGLLLARREVRLDMPIIDTPNLAFFL